MKVDNVVYFFHCDVASNGVTNLYFFLQNTFVNILQDIFPFTVYHSMGLSFKTNSESEVQCPPISPLEDRPHSYFPRQ